jgi:L-fuculose-phosphate aldolase
MFLTQFQKVGRDLFTCGLISGTSGNLSIRLGDRLVITRRTSNKANLEELDLIETGIWKNERNTPLASSELAVHRAIYQTTPATAIVHAHPPHAVALSLTEDEIVPNDDDGKTMISYVPIIGHTPTTIVPGALADIIAQKLLTTRIVMVRGHGSFAIGQILEEAYGITATFEESCKVLCLLKSLQVKQVTEPYYS